MTEEEAAKQRPLPFVSASPEQTKIGCASSLSRSRSCEQTHALSTLWRGEHPAHFLQRAGSLPRYTLPQAVPRGRSSDTLALDGAG
jgi:hypothetical protein